MKANPLGLSSTLYKKFCNFLKRLLVADVLARGPGGPGSGVPRRPVRLDGCPRSGVDGSLLSVWTAVRATNSTRRSSSGAGGASILMPPLFDGLPNILILARLRTGTSHWMARRSPRQSFDRSIVRSSLTFTRSKKKRLASDATAFPLDLKSYLQMKPRSPEKRRTKVENMRRTGAQRSEIIVRNQK